MPDQEEDTQTRHTSPFEAIRRTSGTENEYWSARDLAKILGYKEWRNFTTAIEKAKEASEQSGQPFQTILLKPTKWLHLAPERSVKQKIIVSPAMHAI